MTQWIVLMAGVLTAACSGCTIASGSETGIEGRIMKGPMCPGPGRLDRPCPDKPAMGSFMLVDAADREVARFRTDAEGKFKVAAHPGTYFVVPALGKNESYLGGRREVVVPTAGWVRVKLVFDTGMR